MATRTNRSRRAAAPAATPNPTAAAVLALPPVPAAPPQAPAVPRSVPTTATLALNAAKPYRPRANTQNSTRTQWAALTAAIAAHNGNVGAILACPNYQTAHPNAKQPSAFLAYAVRRGWVTAS